MAGTHKYVWQNAPTQYLPEICEKQVQFTIAQALMSPRLEFLKTNVEPHGEGVYKISAVVANIGFLPTYTSIKAQERKAVRPIEATLELPEGATLVSGKALYDAGQLEGRTNKIYGGWYSSRSITDNQKRLEWVVNAPTGGTARITVRSDRAGTLATDLELGEKQKKPPRRSRKD